MHDWAEFRHFRYLLAILEKQGFRVAAEELHASQPNLTVQARQFQERAAVRLFRKTKSGRIRPTEAGIAFIGLARLLLETRDEVVEALRAIDRGELRSLSFGSSPWTDPKLVKDFYELHREFLPNCTIRPTHGDTSQLAAEILAGFVDAALVTLPLEHPDLEIEEVSRQRLVVCLRKDHPCAQRASLRIEDLNLHLTIFYHPHRHPEAHERLEDLLHQIGFHIREYSRASNPLELQALVKDGHGFALVPEGMKLDPDLTTRAVAGVDWTVDSAVIYRKSTFPKTVPIIVKRLKSRAGITESSSNDSRIAPIPEVFETRKKSVQSSHSLPVQARMKRMSSQ